MSTKEILDSMADCFRYWLRQEDSRDNQSDRIGNPPKFKSEDSKTMSLRSRIEDLLSPNSMSSKTEGLKCVDRLYPASEED